MLKIYEIDINELDLETGLNAISLVERPAVETNFLKFENTTPIHLTFTDDEKHIITGVAIRADHPIYRNDTSFGEHYVVFTKDTIRKLIEKYSKLGLNNIVNIEHSEGMYVDGIYMIESYIVDKERGIQPKEFSDIEDGSWIVSYKVNNLQLWEQIKEGSVKGFSVEGLFYYSENEIDKIEEKHSENTIINEEGFNAWIKNLIDEEK